MKRIFCFLCLTVAFVGSADAQNYFDPGGTAGGTGDFNNAANWSLGYVPDYFTGDANTAYLYGDAICNVYDEILILRLEVGCAGWTAPSGYAGPLGATLNIYPGADLYVVGGLLFGYGGPGITTVNMYGGHFSDYDMGDGMGWTGWGWGHTFTWNQSGGLGYFFVNGGNASETNVTGGELKLVYNVTNNGSGLQKFYVSSGGLLRLDLKGTGGPQEFVIDVGGTMKVPSAHWSYFYDRATFLGVPKITTEGIFTVVTALANVDLNDDSRIDFRDYAIFAKHFLDDTCGPNDWCEGADSDFSGKVDYNDLALLTDYWLYHYPQASNPSPDTGEDEADPNVILTWIPSIYAGSHDVYFGTHFDDVNDANHSSSAFKGNQEPNNFDPGSLDYDTTYYWRVDEVNDNLFGSPFKGQTWSFKTWLETHIVATINAVIADISNFGFVAHNQFPSLATFNGNIYVVWCDADLRPYLTKINEGTGVSESYPLDHDETDVYYAFDDGHHFFSLGIDKNGYIHVMGDMHHGGNPWYRQGSDNPLPDRFLGSSVYGYQMYWVSDQPEDISAFDFVGDSASRHIPGHGFTYQHFRTDVNDELYMAARSTVRLSSPGTIGLGMYKYNVGTQQWTALGDYPVSAPDYKAVVWEPHGHIDVPGDWYQTYFANFKIDKNNRLHLTTPICADSAENATHIVYGYSDDGGLTFHRANGGSIASLPMRVAAGPDQASLPISIYDPGGFVAHFTGLFWDANSNPAIVYQPSSGASNYRYYNPVSGLWISAAYPIGVPGIRGDHHTGPDGMITFIGINAIYRTSGFEQSGIEHGLSLTMPPGGGGGIIRCVDEATLRDENILRGLSEKDGKMVVVSIEF